MEEKCESCKYFKRHSSVHGYGYCKRHSPIISRLDHPKQTPDLWWNEYCEFPNTELQNWCGDWQIRQTY